MKTLGGWLPQQRGEDSNSTADFADPSRQVPTSTRTVLNSTPEAKRTFSGKSPPPPSPSRRTKQDENTTTSANTHQSPAPPISVPSPSPAAVACSQTVPVASNGDAVATQAPTLTRRGSELGFDVNSCPDGSLMRTDWRNRTPLHNDCPTLFIVGARKGGTTSLYHYMDGHPGFKGIRLKNEPMDGETWYFSHPGPWKNFASQFPRGIMSGESSVDNLVCCEVPQRIFKSCGMQAKVVMLLRNPVSRFVSNFLMRARLGTYAWHPTSMKTRISDEARSELSILKRKFARIAKRDANLFVPADWNKYKCAFSAATNMVFEGLYYMFVMNYLCNFPAENILIVNSEEFFNHTSRILTQVHNFLGLKQLDDHQLQAITTHVFNNHDRKVLPHQKLSPTDREELNHVFQPFNEALFKLIHWDDVLWK